MAIIRTKLHLRKKDIARMTAIAPTTYLNYDIKEGTKAKERLPTNHFFENYRTVFGVDLNLTLKQKKLVLTGRHELDPAQYALLLQLDHIHIADLQPGEVRNIPVYDIPVTAGIVSLIRDENHITPSFHIQVPFFNHGAFGVKVLGDSMYPEICDGEYVICEALSSWEEIKNGHVYLVVAENDIATIKKVHIHPTEPGLLMLVSVNMHWGNQLLHADKILKVFKIVSVIKNDDTINKLAIP
ncbi:S24 family peptidase [Chitinophaga sp. MM2321]|uniref:S24 family peptidase n=1 Tax=Chitinophaga sp. MM2321 TaxID=3137178 RepID=UPI0032D5A006